MYQYFLLPALLIQVGSVIAVAQDDLFSDVSASSVFSSTERPASPTGLGRRPTSPERLQEMLLSAGVSAARGESNDFRVELKTSTLNSSATVSVANGQIIVIIPLAQIASKDLDTFNLIALMQASSPTVAFVHNRSQERFELVATMPEDLTSLLFKQRMNELVTLAEQMKPHWNPLPNQQARPDTPPFEPKVREPQASQNTLTGIWIAESASGEAFALQLTENNRFKLVLVKGEANSKSTGTFQLSDNKLTLSGDDGTKLTGSIEKQAEGFEYVLSANKRLTFKSAKQ